MTITGNVSANGGGVGTADLPDVRVRIANSIVSQNFDHQSATNNLDGRVIVADLKHNLIGTGSTILDHATGQVVYRDQPPVDSIPAGNNNIMGVAADSPQLAPLRDNGGLTPTHALWPKVRQSTRDSMTWQRFRSLANTLIRMMTIRLRRTTRLRLHATIRSPRIS